MDDLPFSFFEPSNSPPTFYAGFARLVDALPHSDHKSMERLTEARRLGEEKCWSPVYRYAQELEAFDWGAVKTQLSKDGLWPQEQMNQCSMEDMFAFLQASLQNSSVQSNDALPSSPWILKPGFASYKGKEIHVAGVLLPIERWSELGLGIHASKDKICCMAFSPCPSIGEVVHLKKATKLSLTGAQWQHILELFAKSDDNKTAKIKDIGSLLWPNLPRSRPQKIKNAMSELGRTLRRHVKVTMNKTPAFERAGDVYVASFHIATLLSDEANVYHFGQCKH